MGHSQTVDFEALTYAKLPSAERFTIATSEAPTFLALIRKVSASNLVSGRDLAEELRRLLVPRRHMNLIGQFFAYTFRSADLSDSVLDGTFADVDFRNANLTRAQLNGIYVRVDFRGADLRGAKFSGKFIACRFDSASKDSTSMFTLAPVGSVQYR